LASGLIETFNQDFISLLDMYVFEKWDLLFDEGRGRSLSGGATFVAPCPQHEYIYQLATLLYSLGMGHI
jgi:hypothetical protein